MSTATNDFHAILQTAVMFGVITVILYLALLRGRGTTTTTASPDPVGTRRQAQGTLPSQDNPTIPKKSICTRMPPHLSNASSKIAHTGGSNVLSDGMVAFRHSKVASHESSLSADQQMKNRKERAKVLSNLLADSNGIVSSPPVKGGTVVLTVPLEDIECEKLRRVVYLLATYYSLLLIVTVDSSFQPKDIKNMVQRLRGSSEEDNTNHIAPDILPDHRITASCSVTGRVAFVRQLQRIELVLDFDAELKENLSRFGYRVILYGSTFEKGVSDSQSRLGVAVL